MSSLQYSVIADVSNTELNLKFHSYQLIINWKLLSSEIMPKNLNFKNSFQVEIPILEFFSLNIKDSHSLQRYLIHRLSISSWNILKFWYEIYMWWWLFLHYGLYQLIFIRVMRYKNNKDFESNYFQFIW